MSILMRSYFQRNQKHMHGELYFVFINVFIENDQSQSFLDEICRYMEKD